MEYVTIIKKDEVKGVLSMKIKLCILIMLLLSFLNMGAISNIQMTKNSFDGLETITMGKSEFKENGVKLQYKTKNTIDKEFDRVKMYLDNNINVDYKQCYENQIDCFNDNFDINMKLWSDSIYTYNEITLINKNSKYKTIDLKNILRKIENKNLEDVQYFLYYEGEIKEVSNRELIGELIDQTDIQKANILDINNGCTGTGYLNNGDKVNFALTNYNTGSYVIIGTPIIFATY